MPAFSGHRLDPHAAFLIHRGLKSYFLRWDAQCAAALRVATFLRSHRAVERVRYPGLVGDPGHDLDAAADAGFGTIVAFDIKGGIDRGTRFARSARAVCAGGEPRFDGIIGRRPRNAAARGPDRGCPGVGGDRAAVRYGSSIGIEDVDDLCADLGRHLT
jgi:cystathionine beta-lyase/cystathionine gamma-synthase